MNISVASVLLLAVAGILLSHQALAEDMKAEAKKIVAACMRENGVTAQEVEDLKSGKTDPDNVKDNMKCAAQCMLVKFGFMDSTGQLKVDEIKKRFADAPNKANIDKAVDACRSVKGKNPCDTAFEAVACFKESNLDLHGGANA